MPPSPPSEPTENTETTLNAVSFNQDGSCISAATTTGVIILNTAPYREQFRRSFTPGGISAVTMLFRYPLFALFGGHFPANKVMIYDDNKTACIGELNFRTPVVSVRLRQDRIVVVLAKKVIVYAFVNLKLLHSIPTVENPRGLCEVSATARSAVLVCPGLRIGQIRVESYGSVNKTRFIPAHNSMINCLGLTMDGRYVVSASVKGTLIRVFNTLDGTLLQEVRRGTEKAEIHSLAFSLNTQWLAASSDRGTIHVFALKLDSGTLGNNALRNPPEEPSSPRSPMSSISFMKGALPKYFRSEWSLAQLHLKEGIRYIVAFGREESTVVVVGMDGSYYRCKFDPISGGEMEQLEHHNFMKAEESSES